MLREVLDIEYCACRQCRRDAQARRYHRRLERQFRVPLELLGVTRVYGIRFAVIRFPDPAPDRTRTGFQMLRREDAHPDLDITDERAARVHGARIVVNAPGGSA